MNLQFTKVSKVLKSLMRLLSEDYEAHESTTYSEASENYDAHESTTYSESYEEL